MKIAYYDKPFFFVFFRLVFFVVLDLLEMFNSVVHILLTPFKLKLAVPDVLLPFYMLLEQGSIHWSAFHSSFIRLPVRLSIFMCFGKSSHENHTISSLAICRTLSKHFPYKD